MPKKVNPELRARAVRMVQEHQQDYPSQTAAAQAGAKQLGLGRETVRRWVVQAAVDGGVRAGVTSEEHAEIKRLRAENRRLKKTSPSSVPPQRSSRECSTPATADHGVRRRHESRGPRGRVDLSGAARAGLPGRRADLPGLASGPAARTPDHLRRRSH
jgi:transposase